MANHIYLIGLRPDSYTDFGTRVIIARNELEALKMWKNISEKDEDLKYVYNRRHIVIEKIGSGNISNIFEVTTG